MKVKLKNKYRWLVFLIVMVIFIIISKEVFKKEIFEFDSTIYNFLVNNRNIALNTFFKIVTQLGGAITLIGITILCILFIKDKKYKILVPVNIIIITGLNIILKNFFVRPRPNINRLIEETGYSFPSGHAMANTAFYGMLIYIAYKKIKNKKLRNSICILLSILIFLIALSRVYLGVHYVSDVIAGISFSIAYLILFIKVWGIISEKYKI